MSKSTRILLVMGALVVLGGMSPLNAENTPIPQAKSTVGSQGGSMSCPSGYHESCIKARVTGCLMGCVSNN